MSAEKFENLKISNKDQLWILGVFAIMGSLILTPPFISYLYKKSTVRKDIATCLSGQYPSCDVTKTAGITRGLLEQYIRAELAKNGYPSVSCNMNSTPIGINKDLLQCRGTKKVK